MPSSNTLLYDFSGLVTAPGKLARATASATTADNLFFPAPGLACKRTGWERLATATSRTPGKLWSFSGGMAPLLAKGLDATGLDSLSLADGVGAELGLDTPDSAPVASDWALRSQASQNNRSVYVTAPISEQPVRIGPEAWNAVGPWYGKVHYAGMPRGLPCAYTLGLVGTFLPLLPQYGRAYRVTWHRYDGDGVLLSGPPTARTVVRNVTGTTGYTGAAAFASIGVVLPKQWGTGYAALSSPADLDTSFFWRLWATRTFDTATADSDEEYFLINEAFLTPGNISAGSVVVLDNTPDEFLTVPLNTNTSNVPAGEVGGLANADEPPPLSNDVATWAGVAWWGNIRYRPSANVTIRALGAPLGLQNGDTITIASSAGNVVLIAGTDFIISTGYATALWNFEETALRIAEAANIELRLIGAIQRVYTLLGDSLSPVATMWIEPMLGFTSSRATWYRVDPTDTLSQVGPRSNGIAFSKPSRPDAVPLGNMLLCGPNDAEVQRMVPYRDRLFVFTTRGVYQVSGSSYADFAVQPYALDLHLFAPEAVCYCEDAVYAWCREGLARLSDAGWSIISTPIEPTVQSAEQDADASGLGVAELAFCVADTENHRVWFWYPVGTVTRPMCAAAFVYDTRTQALSRAAFAVKGGTLQMFVTTGCQRASDFRIMGAGGKSSTDSEGWLFLERLVTDADAYVDAGSGSGTSTATNVTATLALQFQVPDAAGSQHWQQTVLQVDGGEVDWRPYPSSIDFSWANELASAGESFIPVSERVVRVEPPAAMRRANQLQLVVASTLAEYFGLVGITQRFRSGSAFARQTEP